MFQISAKFKSFDLGHLHVLVQITCHFFLVRNNNILVASEEYSRLLSVPGRAVVFVPPF